MESSPKTILIVEDDAQVLEVLRQMLEQGSYVVIGARDGLEAREIYSRQQGDIDLVICDMALPKFGGWTVYLMLKEINPRVKVILTSGYLDPKVKTEFIEGGVKDFLPKPYVPETLLRSVRQAIDSG